MGFKSSVLRMKIVLCLALLQSVCVDASCCKVPVGGQWTNDEHTKLNGKKWEPNADMCMDAMGVQRHNETDFTVVPTADDFNYKRPKTQVAECWCPENEDGRNKCMQVGCKYTSTPCQVVTRCRFCDADFLKEFLYGEDEEPATTEKNCTKLNEEADREDAIAAGVLDPEAETQ